tara:strand:- start:13897 stop:15189 length:1293 start_codon:yes stop_codon:yes gene_type:complete
MGNTKSEQFFLESQKYIPGGVNSPVRSFGAVSGTPRFITSGKGSRIWDIDDNEYIDYVCSWGPLVLGHAHDAVVEALKETAERGTSFGAPTTLEIELAKLICDALPSVDSIRLVSSGTEACMSAIRVARAYTKKDKLIKFSGCYHGHSDGLLVKAGSGAMTHGIPTSAGVPESYAQETLLADYNDLESVARLYDQYPGQIAGVIVEPVAGNMGVVPPAEGFLSGLRDITSANESLLIFDEVITGFRVAYGGAQNLYGISPDITCLGKIIGGGLPVGAYSGRRAIMEQVAPLGPMYQAGTLSGNPLAVIAGIKTLLELQDPQKYKQIDSLARRLTTGLSDISNRIGLDCHINRVNSMFTGFFNKGPVNTLKQVELSDTVMYGRYFHALLDRGVYIAPSQFEAAFVSTAHTESDIDTTLNIAEDAMKSIASF